MAHAALIDLVGVTSMIDTLRYGLNVWTQTFSDLYQGIQWDINLFISRWSLNQSPWVIFSILLVRQLAYILCKKSEIHVLPIVNLYHGTYAFAFNPNSCWIETLPFTCHVLVIVPFMKCIRDTAQYCKERKAFDKTILDNQVVYYRLSELATEVEMLRSLLYRAARMYYIAIVSIMNSCFYCKTFRYTILYGKKLPTGKYFSLELKFLSSI